MCLDSVFIEQFEHLLIRNEERKKRRKHAYKQNKITDFFQMRKLEKGKKGRKQEQNGDQTVRPPLLRIDIKVNIYTVLSKYYVELSK